jgi:hypothetical protein
LAPAFRGAGAQLHLTERLIRSAPDMMTYECTVGDSTTWVRPWTVEVHSLRRIMAAARRMEESST